MGGIGGKASNEIDKRHPETLAKRLKMDLKALQRAGDSDG